MSLPLKRVHTGIGASPFVTEREYWEAVQDGCNALRINVQSITTDELARFKGEFARCVAFQTGTVHANVLEAKLAKAVAFTTEIFNNARRAKQGLEQPSAALCFPMPQPQKPSGGGCDDFERRFHGGVRHLQRLKQLLESGRLPEADELQVRKYIARGVLLYVDLYGITPF